MRYVLHNHFPVNDNDGLAERIAGAKALYERPGTPGEKAAAEAALRRMGVDPSKFGSSRPEPSKPKPAESRRNSYSTVRKQYKVVLVYTVGGKTLYAGQSIGWHSYSDVTPFMTEASDEITAEAKAREHAKWLWRTNSGGRVPDFMRYSTVRV